MFFSLPGIPNKAGFMGKFYLVASGVEATRVGLAVILSRVH
jgi:NADH:ubiquinone oxidoreductase subunit 2 (subunit N)